MTATPTRIGFVTQQFRSVVSSDSAVQTKYGNQARDTGDTPIQSYFDSTTDAQTVNDARLTLLKGDRRRFQQVARGVLSFTGGLDFSQVTPTVNVIDDERQADFNAAIVAISVDLGAEKTTITSWG